eukprot:4388486-Pleurochrysis_carterae.AAC.1
MGVHGASFQDDLPPQIVVCSNLQCSLYEVDGGVEAVAREMAELTDVYGWYARAPDEEPLALLTLPGA